MADVNWRAAPFLSQTTGNYPDASDVADKDNIFLTEQGWVYRHFKSLDKSEYWDEVIWAGYVDASVTDNDPVDPINAPNDDIEFLVGDGFQFVSGDYPTTISTIGTVNVQGAGTVDTDAAESYTASIDGTFLDDGGTATYTWKVKTDQGTDVTSDTNIVTIANGTTATATITFKVEDGYNVSCTVGDQAGVQASQTGGLSVTAAAQAPAEETITAVTITSGPNILTATVAKTYTVEYTGTATEGDTTLTLAASPNTGITIVDGTASGKSRDFTVTAADSVAVNTSVTLTPTATNSNVTGSPIDGTTKTVTVKDQIGNVTVALDDSNPDPGDTVNATSTLGGVKGTLTGTAYAWTATAADGSADASKISFGSASAANTTVVVAGDAPAGNYTITCTVTAD